MRKMIFLAVAGFIWKKLRANMGRRTVRSSPTRPGPY